MTVHGVEFEFSGTSVKCMRKFFAAEKKMKLRNKEETQRLSENGLIKDVPEVILMQCRIVNEFLDEVLGPGASKKIGSEDEFMICKSAATELVANIEAEQTKAGMIRK